MDGKRRRIYPVEEWTVTEEEFRAEDNYRNETTFALSNGYIGTRGTLEEGYDFSEEEGLEGNFVNGFYESEDIRYGEWNFGFPKKSQSLLNLPNGKKTRIFLDGEMFDLRLGSVRRYKRTLLMREGVLRREVEWVSPEGRAAEFVFERLVSMARKNVMAQRVRIRFLDEGKADRTEKRGMEGDGKALEADACPIERITVRSCLDADVENHTRQTNPLVDYGPFGKRLVQERCEASEDLLYYEGRTKKSGLSIGCGVAVQAKWQECQEYRRGVRDGRSAKLYGEQLDGCRGDVEESCAEAERCGADAGKGYAEGERYKADVEGNCAEAERYRAEVKESCAEAERCKTDVSESYAEVERVYVVEKGKELICDTFVIYFSSKDVEGDLYDSVSEESAYCCKVGYEQLKEMQKEYFASFWKYGDVKILGDDALLQGMRFNLFHIMQAAGRDGKTGMGAKGLSGEGYEGHYFWDTEMYVLPVFVYTAPEIAKALLEYRFSTLEQARQRARVLGHPKGALFPWRTINGEEASTYFPLGTAQYHINADIAYAFSLYVNVTGDETFFAERAAEVLCETARVWADVGCFAEVRGNRYCICAVTGPDEYNAIVDNNFYTNLMARENIREALNALERLKDMGKELSEDFIERLQIAEEEIVYWKRIVENMYFPYDEKRKIYPLDDGFMMRKPWDDSGIPPEKRHLLYENYHPLFIYRQRMSKQADAILGMYLHSNLFTEEELKRNYDFYQEVTLHHSSLSTCIFGILACAIGYYEESYEYFFQSARMDLDDYHNNFYAGIHAANMAGTWLAVVNGFAGLRANGGKLELKPYVPEAWDGYSFTIRYRGSVLFVELSHKEWKFSLTEGKEVSFWLEGREIVLSEKERVYCEKI